MKANKFYKKLNVEYNGTNQHNIASDYSKMSNVDIKRNERCKLATQAT